MSGFKRSRYGSENATCRSCGCLCHLYSEAPIILRIVHMLPRPCSFWLRALLMQMDYSDVIERVIALPMALTWEAGPRLLVK